MIQVAVGILQREGKVLVGCRPEGKPYSGYWEFPGGKIESHETGEEALARELHEELGITVHRANMWFEHLHHYPDKTVNLILWRVNDFEGDPSSREAQELRWVSLEEMLSLNLLEGNRFIMDRIKELF